MNNLGYYRYCTELKDNGAVIFRSRNELIQFVVKMICNEYEGFIDFCEKSTENPEEIEELEFQRENDRILIEIYAESYLEESVVKEDDRLYKVMRALHKVPKMFCVQVDTMNRGIYNFILEQLNHGDAPGVIFPINIRYVIEGHLKLKREVIF